MGGTGLLLEAEPRQASTAGQLERHLTAVGRHVDDPPLEGHWASELRRQARG